MSNAVSGSRRILVIASQCKAMGTLSFLKEAAEKLYELMIDKDRGQCLPALAAGGLLLDPEVDSVKKALREAFQRASEEQATLLLVFIGHGTYVGNDYFFLPTDAPINPNPDTAIKLVEQIDYAYRDNQLIDGLILLVDTCHSGLVVEQAGKSLVGEYIRDQPRKLRFEMLTASDPDLAAWDGCFTKTLTKRLRDGLDHVFDQRLRCGDLEPIIRRECQPRQVPQFLLFTPNMPVVSDEGLWLARNSSRSRPAWAGTWTGEEIDRLTKGFQKTPVIDRVVAASREHRSLALVGLAGMGKSSLAAALMRPELSDGSVPHGFAHAVAFLSVGQLAEDLARTLADQLTLSVPGFAAARKDFRISLKEEERKRLDPLQIELIGPLRRLGIPANNEVRIVIDDLGQMASASEPLIRAALNELSGGPGLEQIRLIVTARPDTSLPGGTTKLQVDAVDSESLGHYLISRGVSTDLHAEIINRAAGNWLVAAKLTDLVATDPKQSLKSLRNLSDIYAENLRRVGADSRECWRKKLRPVLSVLAAAGIGPILPMPLLCAASARLGGPDQLIHVRDILVDLRGLAVRGQPGEAEEHVGLFHQTFVEYLLNPTSDAFGGIDRTEPHRALAEVLEEMAPAKNHDPTNSLHRYAVDREFEHLWEIGRYEEASSSLYSRQSGFRAENLALWRNWQDRLTKRIGAEHSVTLKARHNVAILTREAGQALDALRLFETLLSDERRILGEEHPSTLSSRNNVAACRGELGDPLGALRLFERLLTDEERILGKNHHQTLTTRNNVAVWMQQTGDSRGALPLFRELLSICESLPGWKDALGVPFCDKLRQNIAIASGEADDQQCHWRLVKALLPDKERIRDEDHPSTLGTRFELAAALTSQRYVVPGALRLLRELLLVRERILGKIHPDTLAVWEGIANSMWLLGDAQGALQVFEALLSDQERILGKDHSDTVKTRNELATLTGRTGDAREALLLFQEILLDQKRILGEYHPDTLKTRNEIAYSIGETGDAREALRLYQELLPVRESILGEDNPDTLKTREGVAYWTREIGDTTEALRLYQKLLPDCKSILGKDNPKTLIIHHYLAILTGQTGDAKGALQLYRELLPIRTSILGKRHPDTLAIRHEIAYWTGEIGDVRGALRLFQELLRSRERCLGKNHPDTLRTRAQIDSLQKQIVS